MFDDWLSDFGVWIVGNGRFHPHLFIQPLNTVRPFPIGGAAHKVEGVLGRPASGDGEVLVGWVREVTAVFSWKCSARGDFLYDVAWCTLWGNWFPAIAQLDLWQRTLNASDLNEDDLKDASLRHHCYELQIAASHFGWFVWTGEDEQLAKLADVVEQVLERGPLAV